MKSFTHTGGFTEWIPVVWKWTLCPALGHDAVIPGIPVNNELKYKLNTFNDTEQ